MYPLTMAPGESRNNITESLCHLLHLARSSSFEDTGKYVSRA